MHTDLLNTIRKEIQVRTSRSSGKGGQNVNKVSSRVEVIFNPLESELFSEEEKALLLERLANKLTNRNELIITCEEERSQLLNKEIAIRKLVNLLRASLVRQKARKATKPGNAAKEKRIEEKKRLSEKKKNRRIDY